MSTYTSLILSESSLTNYWQLQETSGTTATDAKGSNDGTYVSNFTLNQPAATALGKCVLFTTAVSDLDIDIPTQSIPGPLSAEVWYRLIASTDSTQAGELVLKKPTNAQWSIFMFGSNIFWRGSSAGDGLSHAVPVDTNWHHVVGTITGTTAVLYLDGVSVASGTMTAIANGTTATTNNLAIGAANDPSHTLYFHGDLCHVALYNAVLTPTQVAAHYAAGIAVFFKRTGPGGGRVNAGIRAGNGSCRVG